MGSFEIIKRNGDRIPLQQREPFCAVRNAVQNISLMGDDNVQLSFISTELINFSKGDKMIVFGDEYTLRTQVSRTKVSDTHYEYEATFYGVMYELMKSLYRNTDANGKSTKSTFDLTYDLRGFMNVLIYNVSRDYPGVWKFDSDNCPETDSLTIQFSKQNCLQVLQLLCSKDHFNLDFRISQSGGVRTIHIGKFGSKVVPPGGNAFFEWGKGMGLYTLKEEKVDDKSVITRLWVEGGTANIKSGYRGYSDRLQLPFPKRLNTKRHILADGTVVEPGTEMIGIDDDANRFFENIALKNTIGSDEDSVEFDSIHPKRIGEVTALVGDDVNSFIDSTMDFDLNEKDANGTKYLIDKVTAKINFLTGRLAGQQFELVAGKGYDHSNKKFSIIPFTDERGLTIPTTGTNEAYRISLGDKYNITDINLPVSYEENAEEELWYAGLDAFNSRSQARAQYSLSFDRSYFLDSLPADSETTVFKVGDYVPIRDKRFGIEKTIRIQKVSRNLMLRHDYQITLSDVTAISVMSQTVVDVIEHNKIIESNRLKDLTKARRGWRTTEELRNMVYDTDGFFDPENIRPNSIDTNMLTVGSKSQQFVLIDVVFQANVNGLANRLNASAGTLAHLSIDEKGVRQWSMGASEFTMSNNGGYYLFAKCSKTGSNGVWYLTQEQLKFEIAEDPNNFYFQVGIISSKYEDNFRDFISTYGFTRINGNTITTGKIVTSDGECYLDLDGNKFRIGDTQSSIDWGVTAKNQLTLKNVRLMSASGDVSHLGVFRGKFNIKYVYYPGDEVEYTSAGETCTYRYINANPSSGNLPTNSVFWSVVAKGEKGDKGDSVFYTYHDSHTKPAIPTGSGDTGGWHTDSTESVIWMSTKRAASIAEGNWGIPFRVRGADGTSITIKGTVNSVGDLPMIGNTNGDSYLLNGYLYIWTGIEWSNVGKIQGDAGKSSYLHKKYSDDGGKKFTAGNGETPGRWLGLYVDQSPIDSDNPAQYTWSDTKGEQGTPGEPGADGKTTYLHIKYSNDGGMSFTASNGEEPGAWIGQYTDFEIKDSDDPTKYTWSKIKGDSGSSGSDAAAGEYYEYRYAKNGSTSVPPELDFSSPKPPGWTTEMPTPGPLEYVWCTIAKKSEIAHKTSVNIPVGNSDLKDISGNGYDGSVGSGMLVADGNRYALAISGAEEARIPYDLPFGESFTLCLWIKTDQKMIRWMFNGYNGRDYEGGTISVPAYTWVFLSVRFNDRTVTIFKNAEQLQIASISEKPVGFSLYDDNMFGSNIMYDDVRVVKGALPDSDIKMVMLGTADRLVQNWSTPIRVNPYDGKDGNSVSDADVEYAISDSNSVAPTDGWQTTAPQWTDGLYIWSRTKMVYSDGKITYTNPACITGGKGNTGSPGSNGQDGVGIQSITEEYYLSSSATSLLNGSWTTVRPEWKDQWYLWTRSVITYTNKTSKITDPICVTGSQGPQGLPGLQGLQGDRGENGINGKSTYFHIKYSPNPNGYPLSENPDVYIGTYVDFLPFDSLDPKSYKWSRFQGLKGENGIAGMNGVDGKTYYLHIKYSDDGGSTFTANNGETPGMYIGVMTDQNQADSNNPKDYTWSLIKGDTGPQGPQGECGPAVVYRGIYSHSSQYYGTKNRVDVVQYNGVFHVTRVDAGVFSAIYPTNSTKWNNFGSQFESVATSLLLAENANIANFIFRNQRMESQGNTGGTPNIILDGLNNIASFAAGKVVFDRDIAKLGWLQIVGNDLVGYDTNGEERIKITNSNLPSVSALAHYDYLQCTYSVQADATFDEQYMDVERPGYRSEIRDDWNGDYVEEDNDIWIDITFTIQENDTVVEFDYQCGAAPSIGLASTDRRVIVKDNATNKQVASSNTESLSTKLNKGTYTATYWATFNFNRDWSGTMNINFRDPIMKVWARQTYIGNNGILVTGGGNYFLFKPDLLELSFGNNGLKCTSGALQKKVNGVWTNL